MVDEWARRLDGVQYPIFRHSAQALKQIENQANPSLNECRQVILDQQEANQDIFLQESFSLEQKDLFKLLMKKQQSVHVTAVNREKYWPLVPGAFKTLIQTDSFCASSVFAADKPIGLFYMDRYASAITLTETDYAEFKKLCSKVSRCIKRMSENTQ